MPEISTPRTCAECGVTISAVTTDTTGALRKGRMYWFCSKECLMDRLEKWAEEQKRDEEISSGMFG